MKMYPIKGSKYCGKQEWVELSKSVGSVGKQLLTFPDGTKAHIRDEDISNFFEFKAPLPVVEAVEETPEYAQRPKPKPKTSSKYT